MKLECLATRSVRSTLLKSDDEDPLQTQSPFAARRYLLSSHFKSRCGAEEPNPPDEPASDRLLCSLLFFFDCAMRTYVHLHKGFGTCSSGVNEGGNRLGLRA